MKTNILGLIVLFYFQKDSDIVIEAYENELYSSDEEIWKSKTDTNEKPKTYLQKLLETNGYFQPVLNSVQRSPAELLLMAMKCSLKHKLSLSAISDSLKLINCTLDDVILPQTRYKIDQMFNSKKEIIFHALCPNCCNYLGTIEDLPDSINCNICESLVNVSNPSCPCYFAVIDPSKRIIESISANSDYYENLVTSGIGNNETIKDIYDGQMYRKFLSKLADAEQENAITATLNTDGAPVFESSNYSIWPVYLEIHQLPFEFRSKNIITCGLWIGNKKPEMIQFLSVFVDFIKNLNNTGIHLTLNDTKRVLKLYILMVCVDTVARAPMNGTLQFNAHFGCDWCEHPGEWYSGCMRYPVLDNVHNRNTYSMIVHSRTALESGKAVNGVKYCSPLINLQHFDIIKGFVPDYMHCFVGGVAKQFTSYLLNSLSQYEFNLINSLLKKVKAPHQISRLSRPLEDRGKWKTREWENWVLYYSAPLLELVISKKLFKHWTLLVNSLHILLKTEISYDELNEADEMLYSFVHDAQELYGKQVMTYNVHQLLHIVESVYNWGPLWAHSAFPFESANYQLLNSIQCAKGINQQIIRYINLQHSVNILEKLVYPNSSEIVKSYCDGVMHPRVHKSCKLSDVTYFGKGKHVSSKLKEKFELPEKTRYYIKMVKDSCLYLSIEKINCRSCNSYAILCDSTFIQIRRFFVDEESNTESCLCNVIQTRPSKYCPNLHVVLHVNSETITCQTNLISKVCVFIENNKKRYICSVPNLYHY